MKKRVISMILAVLMLTALTACGGDADRIAQLEAENAALKAQVEELTAQLEASGAGAGLSDWHFESYAWSSSNGANVTFVGTPVRYAEGMSAEFTAWLEGEMSVSAPCEWNGSAFVASVPSSGFTPPMAILDTSSPPARALRSPILMNTDAKSSVTDCSVTIPAARSFS